MTEEFKEIAPQAEQGMETLAAPTSLPAHKPRTNWLETLARMGLGETVVRVGTNVLTLVVVLAVVWLMRSFYKSTPLTGPTKNVRAAAPTAESPVAVGAASQAEMSYRGIPRMALIHTNIPARPRQDIIKYTIAKGDTAIGIAQKFNLSPKTVMFGNYYTLGDNPEILSIGSELNILPVDGYYYRWNEGDGLNGVAKFLNVKPEDIINYPLNHLDAATIGNYSNPNIKPGTWLIIPGGTRPYNYAGGIQPGITRTNPALARVSGSGACGKVYDGAVGSGTFVWPANKHYLSGYDYSPETNHRGIDIAGNIGEPVYAVDSGVIVYAGWNEYGYGNMIMIDHGNGWQSLYGHLSAINVICGGSVVQGQTIGLIGSTGNSSGSHLHFELMHTQYSKVNPWLYLPPP
jgi:hypothetical protein